MKILICGFYGHSNLGDDCYQIAFRKLLKGFDITFQELSELDKVNLENYSTIIVGGGDLMNDFYSIKYEECLKNYSGYKIAISVGFSFEACTKRNFVSYFDDIILRSKKDLNSVSKIIGSLHTHYLSDLVFDLPIEQISPRDTKERKNVGLFLVGSLVDNASFVFPLLCFINFLITNGYFIHLIPMHSEVENKSNDHRINDVIYRTFSFTGSIRNHPEQNFYTFSELLKSIDFGVCIRYHGHIFCTKMGIPFFSIPITRKVQIYNEDIPYNTRYEAKMNFDPNYNVISFDVEDAKQKFFQIRDNYSDIHESLIFYSKINSVERKKVLSLLQNNKKRKVSSLDLILLNPEEIYNKYLRIFCSKGINIFSDNFTDLQDIVSPQWVDNIADNICYELTKDPANDYIYGTRVNLKNNPKKLRDIIYYIYQVNLEKIGCPKLNMNYIKQDSFRGLHRAGWQYAIDALYCYSGDHGVLLDTYVDRTFGWASNVLSSTSVIPYTNRWIGFIHHTFDEDFSKNNCETLFSNSDFIDSLPLCCGIFCLTEYLCDLIRERIAQKGFGNIIVESLHHPTIFTNLNFDMEEFLSNRKIVNIGSWYRNPVTIHLLSNYLKDKNSPFSFASLKGKRMDSNFCPDSFKVFYNEEKGFHTEDNIWSKYFIKYINFQSDSYSKNFYQKLKERNSDEGIEVKREDVLDFLESVEVLQELKNGEYDKLLSNSVVFLDLVDASTANTILECIVRETPLLLNRIPPTVELMGEGYPLFYSSIEEAAEVLNFQNIQRAYEYMKTIDREKYRIDSFVESFLNSKIYQNIVV